jgi:molecular chaperone DnaJ
MQTAGSMRFKVNCPHCGGTGRLRSICRECGGEGRVSRADTIDLKIPAGVNSGSRVRVAGRGNAGHRGGPPGDLYIITNVRPHAYFERRGDDIYTSVPITVAEASLGAKIEVPTIDGRALLRIPPGTNSGQRFRLREKGVPSAKRAGQRGDQFVEVQIVAPSTVDERVRNLLRELGKLAPEDPRRDIFARAGV